MYLWWLSWKLPSWSPPQHLGDQRCSIKSCLWRCGGGEYQTNEKLMVKVKNDDRKYTHERNKENKDMLIVIKAVFWDYKVLMSWGVRSKVADGGAWVEKTRQWWRRSTYNGHRPLWKYAWMLLSLIAVSKWIQMLTLTCTSIIFCKIYKKLWLKWMWVKLRHSKLLFKLIWWFCLFLRLNSWDLGLFHFQSKGGDTVVLWY